MTPASSPAPTGQLLLTATELADLLNGLAGRPYMTEAVDQRTHALQAAELAHAAGADDELVIAAALHDIGRAEPVRLTYPDLPHELAGGAFARDRLTLRIAWVIEHHVPAKRYLVATDPSYRSHLSPTSITTLAQQGGPVTPDEVARFDRQPWARDTLSLRRWDDQAKDPQKPGMPVDYLLAVLARWTATVTQSDARNR